jgi:ATP-dependent Clp protease protease subunit
VGTVDSIGNVVFLAGDDRYAAQTSSFMFHGVGFDVQNTRFEKKTLTERLDSLQNDQSLISDIIIQRTNINAQEAEALFLQAAFIRADDAKARGIINDIRDVQVPQGAPFIQLVFQG